MKLIKKGTKLYSIIHLKCPHCQESDLFLDRNAYHLKMLDKMPKRCSNCQEDLERETGFYYGAMMISHATTTVISLLVHAIVYQFYGWQVLPNLIPILIIFVSLFPLIFRTSRAIWLNIFVKFSVNAPKE